MQYLGVEDKYITVYEPGGAGGRLVRGCGPTQPCLRTSCVWLEHTLCLVEQCIGWAVYCLCLWFGGVVSSLTVPPGAFGTPTAVNATTTNSTANATASEGADSASSESTAGEEGEKSEEAEAEKSEEDKEEGEEGEDKESEEGAEKSEEEEVVVKAGAANATANATNATNSTAPNMKPVVKKIQVPKNKTARVGGACGSVLTRLAGLECPTADRGWVGCGWVGA